MPQKADLGAQTIQGLEMLEATGPRFRATAKGLVGNTTKNWAREGFW